MAKVLVVGSINCDISVYCDRHPAAGETVTGHDFAISLGGKGANQAVASKLCGAESHLLARVGDDSNGRDMLARLNKRGVDTSGVGQAKEFTTGTALITVDKTGENRIVVVAGANEALDAADINHAKSSFRSA
ncbi:MAG: PfkB family carbohydrate kinase, partial [Gammaproteobacteria bacterium]|nr:PfkB family carbohydrate kinase [Gammaproteobacteria bacterium]